MATVPNWIAKAVIYQSYDFGRRAEIIPTTGWRATKTQVIVTCEGSRGPVERRFRLNDLTEVGHRDAWSPYLADPTEDRTRKAQAEMIRRSAIDKLMTVIDGTSLDPSAMDAEELVIAIGRIQRAATKAMADLSEVL